MNTNEIYKFLNNCGCCNVCCLRYLKARGDDYYTVKDSLIKLGVNKDNFEFNDEEIKTKKQRKNPCVACINLLSEDFIEKLLNEIISNSKLNEYDCKEFLIALSLPLVLNLRQLSLWIGLITKFNENNISKEVIPDASIKEILKLILGPKVCKMLNKNYNQEGIMINIQINCENEMDELKQLIIAKNEIFKDFKQSNNKIKKSENFVLTRGYFEKYLVPNKLDFVNYKKYIPIPPLIPSFELLIGKITLTGPTIFVAGRYKKFSRNLSHSPWILNGKRVMEDSIQEIIIRAVSPHFKVDNESIIFSSSGREDVDVRCLGSGRPFVLEIPDSKRTVLPKEIAKDIEIKVEKSNLVSIHNIQIVPRDEISQLKSGEDNKKKTYRALCIIDKPATLEILKALDMPNGFEINQITPIRVLHRRPLHIRPRKIYSVKGYVHKSNSKILILDIVTQAGTYVKELIHGEFGRTSPSISSILNIWIDIISLDVTAVDLDWPPNINNRI